MKRFLLFAGDDYYPSGGWGDFVGSYDSVEEAIPDAYSEWAHIVDTATGDVVREGTRPRNRRTHTEWAWTTPPPATTENQA